MQKYSEIQETSVIDLARGALGEEGARLFSIAFSGQRVYVPTWDRLSSRSRSRLRDVLGDESTEHLCEALAGEHIDVPVYSSKRFRPLDKTQIRCIKTFIEKGRTNNEIAARVGTSTRTVRKYRKTA